MPARTTPKAQPMERKRWLETLLDRMSAPPAIMRQHLGEGGLQQHALGSAAEKGIRDLLRLVLPQRLAITSGFLREPGGSLAAITPAPDALGVIEVKDTSKGSEELASAKGEGGALEHIARLGIVAPNAFRAIVLFRGNNPRKPDEDEDIGDQNPPEPTSEEKNKGGRPTIPEIMRAKERLAPVLAKRPNDQVPHVIYCASYLLKDGNGVQDGSYLAFYDFLAQSTWIHEYHGDQTRALAGFLRMITGFFAVRGLISPSLHLDLLPTKPDRTEKVPDATTYFHGLHAQLLLLRAASNGTKPFYEVFVTLLKDADNVVSKVVTGRDANNLPTAGAAIMLDFTIQKDGNTPIKQTSVAFFYLAAPDVFVCTDASNQDEERWTIEKETVEEYRRRALRDSNLVEPDNIAPGKRRNIEAETKAPETEAEKTI